MSSSTRGRGVSAWVSVTCCVLLFDRVVMVWCSKLVRLMSVSSLVTRGSRLVLGILWVCRLYVTLLFMLRCGNNMLFWNTIFMSWWWVGRLFMLLLLITTRLVSGMSSLVMTCSSVDLFDLFGLSSAHVVLWVMCSEWVSSMVCLLKRMVMSSTLRLVGVMVISFVGCWCWLLGRPPR